MGYKLFLDDVRQVTDCLSYMHTRIGKRNPIYAEDGWLIARNYEEFVNILEEYGLPEFVSFDHDLAAIHYEPSTWTESFEYFEETGLDCARFLKKYCKDNSVALPEWAVHSMNPVGTENIKNCLNE